MCWSIEVSAISAAIAWIVCVILWWRNRTVRDRWYAMYLFTFTFTQLVDIALWYEEGRVGLSVCDTPNLLVSKYVIPLVVMCQNWVQCSFPSDKLARHRTWIKVLDLLPPLAMGIQFHCSTIVQSISGPTLCWGGFSAPDWQIVIHSGLVAALFALLMPPVIALLHISCLAAVMGFLFVSEGTLAMGSKWCSYCLIYSVVYLLEPWLYSSKADEAWRRSNNVASRSSRQKRR